MHPQAHALLVRQRVVARAELEVRGAQPLRDVVAPPEEDAVDGRGELREARDCELPVVGELPLRREREDGRPLLRRVEVAVADVPVGRGASSVVLRGHADGPRVVSSDPPSLEEIVVL